MNNFKSVEVSIIIRTLNEAKNLGSLLKGIHGQNYKDWEIILVDSGSTDGTIDIASSYGARIYNIPQKEFTFGRSLNMGCEKARGKYLVFASGHVWPVTNNWLGNLVEPFQDPSIAMVYGRQRGTSESHLTELRDLTVQFGNASTVLVDEAKGNNGNSAIRKDLWLSQPFDETLPGLEDVDWARKVESRNLRVYYSADASVYHLHEETLRQVYIRSLRETIAVKRMFPYYQYGMLDLLKGLPYFMIRDLLFGLRNKMFGKLFQIPTTRFSHLFGIYKGVRYRRKLAVDLAKQSDLLVSETEYPKNEQGDGTVHDLSRVHIDSDQALVRVGFTKTKEPIDRVNYVAYNQRETTTGSSSDMRGYDYSGLVVRLGSDVSNLSIGQKVCGKSLTLPADILKDEEPAETDCQWVIESAAHLEPIPWDIPLSYGTFAVDLAVCLAGIRVLDIERGSKICVVGAGQMGNICAQILNSQGLKVMVVDQHQRCLNLLKKYDVDTLTAMPRLDDYDYLVETTGNVLDLQSQINGTNPKKILVLGVHKEQVEMTGATSLAPHGKAVFCPQDWSDKDWENAMSLMRNGGIRLDDLVKSIKLHEYREQTTHESSQMKPLITIINVTEELEAL